MNINLKKVSLAFLFTTSCLTQTAYGMMVDEKEMAKKCHKVNPRFFIQEFKKELKNVQKDYFEATKNIDEVNWDDCNVQTKECTTLAKEKGEKTFPGRLQYQTCDSIINFLENDWTSTDVFLKSYFSHTNMNDTRWSKTYNSHRKTSYYFCDPSTASQTVKRENYGFNVYVTEEESKKHGRTEGAGWYQDGGSFATQMGDGMYKCGYSKARNGGQNSRLLFNLLDSAIKRIGQKHSKLKMWMKEIGITPDKKAWKAIAMLNENKLEVTQPLLEACLKLLRFEQFDLSRYLCVEDFRRNDFLQFLNIFKDCKDTVGQYPEEHHIESFERLIGNKIPISAENIDKVMNMTRSIDCEEGPLKENLKRFNLAIDTNYVTSSKKAAEWFKGNYKTEPTTQDLLVVRHMMRQEGLKLTPSSFKAAKALIGDKEKMNSWPTKAQIEIAEVWMANSKETVTRAHTEAGEHVLKVGFPKLTFPELKAAYYLMAPRLLIVEPTKLEIEATVYLMNMQTFKERTAPQVDQIRITAKVMSLGFAKPNMKTLKKAREALKNKKLENLTKEDLVNKFETF